MFVDRSKRAPAWSDHGVVVLSQIRTRSGVGGGGNKALCSASFAAGSVRRWIDIQAIGAIKVVQMSSSIPRLIISYPKYLNRNIGIFTRTFISNHFSIDVVDIVHIHNLSTFF